MALFLLIICNGCAQRWEPRDFFIGKIPVIRDLGISDNFPADRTITAKVERPDNRPLEPIWRVRCNFHFKTNPSVPETIRRNIDAAPLPDNLFKMPAASLRSPYQSRSGLRMAGWKL
jgi:hypothetical protein